LSSTYYVLWLKETPPDSEADSGIESDLVMDTSQNDPLPQFLAMKKY
jgi:hypothetical protein